MPWLAFVEHFTVFVVLSRWTPPRFTVWTINLRKERPRLSRKRTTFYSFVHFMHSVVRVNASRSFEGGISQRNVRNVHLLSLSKDQKHFEVKYGWAMWSSYNHPRSFMVHRRFHFSRPACESDRKLIPCYLPCRPLHQLWISSWVGLRVLRKRVTKFGNGS